MSDVINGVPRELLERINNHLHSTGDFDPTYPPGSHAINESARLYLELRALLTAQPQASALTEAAPGCFVQPVPSHCDRITWRGKYYQLPNGLPQASAAQSAPDWQRLESVLDDVCSKGVDVFPGVPIYSISLIEIAEVFRRMSAQSAPAGEREAPDGKLLVSAEPLRRVLNALVNAPHQIRELQATREPVALFADNPINILIAEYNAAHGDDE